MIKNGIPRGKNGKVLVNGQIVSIIRVLSPPIKIINGKKWFLGYPRKRTEVTGKLIKVGLKKSIIQLQGETLEGVKNDRITVTA